jgi:hypothetical protein
MTWAHHRLRHSPHKRREINGTHEDVMQPLLAKVVYLWGAGCITRGEHMRNVGTGVRTAVGEDTIGAAFIAQLRCFRFAGLLNVAQYVVKAESEDSRVRI